MTASLTRVNASGQETGRVEVPDHLEWNDDRHFAIEARRDGAVQVSGTNVFPEHVAKCIRSYPGVQDSSTAHAAGRRPAFEGVRRLARS
ncbi:MAG: hypothetical protein WKF37_17230 [Bryobacteraceae bacterium]